jgi:hypothetical protein
MATLAVTNPTLADVAKRLDPEGRIDNIVELLNQTNEILQDATAIEGNLPTGHRHTIRTGLPTATWRRLYEGVAPGRSTTVQVTDSCGTLEQYAIVDQQLAELNGNTAAWRMSEDRAFIEAMNQEVAGTVFYGNEGTAPAEFTGLAPRYNSTTADNGEQIINAAGSGSDNTSMWLVVWGPNTCHMIYPKGSVGGLQMNDDGLVTLQNQATAAGGTNGFLKAYQTHYRWQTGLTVRDWQYVSRIANIDVSDLNTIANTKNLVTWMIQAAERIPNLGMGRAAFYCNRTIREKLRLGILEKVSSNLTFENVAGQRIMSFDGIPVRRCDQLVNTESVVS